MSTQRSSVRIALSCFRGRHTTWTAYWNSISTPKSTPSAMTDESGYTRYLKMHMSMYASSIGHTILHRNTNLSRSVVGLFCYSHLISPRQQGLCLPASTLPRRYGTLRPRSTSVESRSQGCEIPAGPMLILIWCQSRYPELGTCLDHPPPFGQVSLSSLSCL